MAPKPAQAGPPNGSGRTFLALEGGQTIPPHHSIAKYLKNLKLIPRTTTFFLRHCVNSLKSGQIHIENELLSTYILFCQLDSSNGNLVVLLQYNATEIILIVTYHGQKIWYVSKLVTKRVPEKWVKAV